MPLSRRPVAWLASLAVLMNLFVVPLSQALTTQERASLLLGGFCSTSSDSLLRLKLGADVNSSLRGPYSGASSA